MDGKKKVHTIWVQTSGQHRVVNKKQLEKLCGTEDIAAFSHDEVGLSQDDEQVM